MKKIIFTTIIFLTLSGFAYEDVPLLIDTSLINIDIEQQNKNDINVDNMKKSNSIKKAKDEINTQKPIIKLDTRQIHHQRTLDYMNNRGSGTMLPIF